MGKFQNLRVWQLAKDLAVRIYKIAKGTSLSKDYGLRDQIQRSAASIASNMAEGDDSGSDKRSIHHFHIAKGSSAELITQIIIANEIGYINDRIRVEISDECDKICAMLAIHIKARSSIE